MIISECDTTRYFLSKTVIFNLSVWIFLWLFQSPLTTSMTIWVEDLYPTVIELTPHAEAVIELSFDSCCRINCTWRGEYADAMLIHSFPLQKLFF